MHHVDPPQVDQGFTDLETVQDQGHVGQILLVLGQVVPQLVATNIADRQLTAYISISITEM